MRTINIFRIAAAAAAVAWGRTSPAAPAKLNVVATTPDLAAIAREIGGDLVDVTALAKPTEDPHFVDAKPGLSVALNRADVLIEGGADLEVGWLPPLLESSRNSKIAVGAPGRISASQGVRLLEIPTTLDRARGDVHALGNPHFLIDPVNVKLIAGQVAEHFSKVSPASAAIFDANRKRFETALDAKFTEWKNALAPYRGAKIVTYHKDFVYLAARFELEVVATLEPKPGIAPSAAHMAQVITTMRATKARAILVQPFQNRKTAEKVASQTGGIVLDISQQPGAVPNTATYFTLMDYIVKSLVTAFKAAP